MILEEVGNVCSYFCIGKLESFFRVKYVFFVISNILWFKILFIYYYVIVSVNFICWE